MLIGLVAEEGEEEEERESHSKVGTLLGPTMMLCWMQQLLIKLALRLLKRSKWCWKKSLARGTPVLSALNLAKFFLLGKMRWQHTLFRSVYGTTCSVLCS